MNLTERVIVFSILFTRLEACNGRIYKENLIKEFREKYPELNEELDFCFEILAGKHKLGYTYLRYRSATSESPKYVNSTIKELVNALKEIAPTDDGVTYATFLTPFGARDFIANLVNRYFKLGYSNKDAMITNLSPMLAKKYPETFKGEHYYYIQEKLDGNRCIAYYDFKDKVWKFTARSGKPLKVNFDMSWASKYDIFDGEVMTKEHRDSKDFNATSGAINSKYGDKSGLHYYIYDIIENCRYQDRLLSLNDYNNAGTGNDCTILPVLDKIWLWPNTEYNEKLDEWLDKVTDKGGEGIILRDPDGMYEHKRSNNLLKYKKTQSMDLRIKDWNEGKGKYEGMIGSFFCVSDDGEIEVNVAGMSDDIRSADPALFMNKIVEVAYFSITQSTNKLCKSLRFPRIKRFRDDKNDTSIY